MAYIFNPTLNELCLEAVVQNLKLHENSLVFLTQSLKTKLLKKALCSMAFCKDADDLNTALYHLGHKDLDKLNISLWKITNDTLKIIETCKNLQEIFLVGEESTIGAENLKHLFQQLKQLKSVSLIKCNEVDDDLIITIAENNPQIKFLDVYGCKNVADRGIIALCKSSTLLILNLSHTKLGNLGCKAISESPSAAKLKRLHISGCELVDENGLIAITNTCRNLEVFVFNGCTYKESAFQKLCWKSPKFCHIHWSLNF